MTDRTTVTIHSCPPHRVRAVIEVLRNHDLIDDPDHDGPLSLHLGQDHTDAEFRAGDTAELANDLVEAAPETAFTVYEEPAYEWLGTTHIYVPDLGSFTADCDVSGTPVFTQTQILGLLGQSAATCREGLGVPWRDAISAMPEHEVVEPERFVVRWCRSHHEIAVLGAAEDGTDLLIPAPAEVDDADTALTEQGFLRVEPWTNREQTSGFSGTHVYRLPG